MKWETPYSKKAIRDRTLGEQYTKAHLEAKWDPEKKKAYEEQKAKEAANETRKVEADTRKRYDAEERARWREAQLLAAQKQKQASKMRDDPLYKVTRYDAAGHRRSNVEMLILVAVKIIRVDDKLFEDQVGAMQFPHSPIYAPRDWKLQKMYETSTLASEMGIKEVSDIQDRSNELSAKLAKVSTEIRKKKAFLGRIESLHTAIQEWEAAQGVIDELDKLPDDQKDTFKAEHEAQINTYNHAMGVFYKFSGRYAKTPIMVYDANAHKKVVCVENIANTLDNVNTTKKELDGLQEQRKAIASDISKVRRISTGLALAQNDLFVHGPQFTEEKLREIRARAKEQENQAIEQYDKMREVTKEDFENYVDEMLKGNIEEHNGFEKARKGDSER